MKFAMLPDRLRQLILLFTIPACGLCACTPPIVMNRPASACSTLIPSTLRSNTPGAPMPDQAQQGAWMAFGVAQTGQLDKANADKAGAIEIVESCEKRDAEAAQAITKHKRHL